jgi:DMSO/TMAO reductase YedYZ molybdopterin-dependent catalytic subunit
MGTIAAMSFFSRNKDELVAQGIDPARVPPGQYVTDRFPVLHAGTVPDVDLGAWSFSVTGLVGTELTWGWDEFLALPTETKTYDIHCVTKWSKLDTSWTGIPVRAIWDRLDVDDAASHVMVTAYHGFTANLPIEDFLRDDNLFAHTYEEEPLDAEHGWPLRLVVPHLYFWKSVKWVTGFVVMDGDRPGFWERNGYHMYGDPFREQRFWGD